MPKLADFNLDPTVVALLRRVDPQVDEYELSEPADGEGVEITIHHQGLHLSAWCSGEGLSGDYDEDDPEDRPLVRVDLSYLHPTTGELIELPCTSNCTLIDDRAPWAVRLAACLDIFSEVFSATGPAPDPPPVQDADDPGDAPEGWGESLKRLCEELAETSTTKYSELAHAVAAAKTAQALDQDLPASAPRAPTSRM